MGQLILSGMGALLSLSISYQQVCHFISITMMGIFQYPEAENLRINDPDWLWIQLGL